MTVRKFTYSKATTLFGFTLFTREITEIIYVKKGSFYEINRDCNVDALWENRWTRNSFLKPMFKSLLIHRQDDSKGLILPDLAFTLESLQVLLKLYGVSEKSLKVYE